MSQGDEIVSVNPIDGYINATALFEASNKDFNTWKNFSTPFLNCLSKQMNEPIASNDGKALIYCKDNIMWVHYRIALNIASWVSPEFDVLVGGQIHKNLLMDAIYKNSMSSTNELIQYLKILEGKIDNLQRSQLSGAVPLTWPPPGTTSNNRKFSNDDFFGYSAPANSVPKFGLP